MTDYTSQCYYLTICCSFRRLLPHRSEAHWESIFCVIFVSTKITSVQISLLLFPLFQPVLSGVNYCPISHFPCPFNDHLEVQLLASSLPLSTKDSLWPLHGFAGFFSNTINNMWTNTTQIMKCSLGIFPLSYFNFCLLSSYILISTLY
jgi:hypothetical protein